MNLKKLNLFVSIVFQQRKVQSFVTYSCLYQTKLYKQLRGWLVHESCVG